MNRVAGVLLLVLVAASGWIAYATALEGDPPAPSRAVTGDPLDAPAPAPFSIDDWSSGETDAGLDDPFADDDLDRSEVEVEGAPRPGALLRVVDGTGAAVADVEVRWVEQRDAIERNQGRDYDHWSELAERYGTAARTGDDGTVRLPPVRDRLIVVARAATYFGVRMLRSRHRPEETLRLEQDLTLSFVVRDVAGDGVADVPIGVHQQRGRAWNREVRLTSGADGVVVLRHFQLHRDRRGGPSAEFLAALLVPLARPVEHAFRGDAIPVEPIELVLPATGSVALRVIGPDGMPLSNPAQVRLRAAGRSDAWSPLGKAFDEFRGRKEIGDGVIELPLIGLGLELEPHVRLDDDEFNWRGARFVGPMHPGERVEVAVPLPDWIGLMCGTLVDAEGEPLAGARPTFLISSGAGRVEGELMTVGDEGRFELPFRVREEPAPLALEVRNRGEIGPIGAVVPLGGLHPGRTELGVIALQGLARLASGCVTNDLGEPLPRARVTVQVLTERDGRARWQNVAFVETRTDDEGRYEIRADPPALRMRLSFLARNHSSLATDEITTGAEIDAVLARTGTLRGEIVAPRWLPDEALHIRLVAAGGEPTTYAARTRSRRDRVQFVFASVRPGFYDFSVRMRGFPDPVFRVDGVRIEPGANDAARLGPLDLSQSVFRYELRAVGPEGSAFGDPGAPLVARVVRPGGQSDFVAFPWRAARVEVFSASPRLEIVQLGYGTRPREHVVTYGRTDLVFERLQPLELSLPGARAACGVGRRVRVSAVLVGETGLPHGMQATDQRSGTRRGYSRAQLSKSGGAWLRETDVVRMQLMRDGQYDVVLRLYEPGVSRPVPVRIGRVQVTLDVTREARAEVAVDPARVQKALAELTRRKAAEERRQ